MLWKYIADKLHIFLGKYYESLKYAKAATALKPTYIKAIERGKVCSTKKTNIKY